MYARTPNEVAELIKDLIKDKTVVELGTGEGEFLKALLVYTNKLSGIEQQTESKNVSEAQGFTVVNADFVTQPLADGVVYYSYLNSSDLDRLLKKIDDDKIHAKFIIGQPPSYAAEKYLVSIATEVREACNGQFKVFIIDT